MNGPLPVPRATFSIEDPWAVPPKCERMPLVRATDGMAPRLATTVAAMWDDEALTLLFSAIDDHVAATHLTHDAPLYQEDVVEAFLAPRPTDEYFELEVNPLGTTFDARIESPDGVRATMRTELGWTCRGLFAAVRRVGASGVWGAGEWGARSTVPPAQPGPWTTLGMTVGETVVRIPFASLDATTPRDGEEWRANFFRIDRHPSGDEFSAWRPTLKTPPDFHVTSAFGVLRFEARAC